MKLGFVSAILDGWTFEEVIDIAADYGYDCVEVACWPAGGAERRYAGVSHIDVVNMDETKASAIMEYCQSHEVEISSLAYYPNTMDPDAEKRAFNIAHLKKVIDASKMLKVGMVTTFIGRDQNKDIEENLADFERTWPEIVAYAEARDVKIAIENCPMLFGRDQWPGGQNLATSPKIWREMFRIIPSANFGINFDPSHFVWQMMDYLKPLYEFKDRILHIHFKDIKLFKDKLDQVGIMAYPLEFMAPKLPGQGDVDWGAFVSALRDIGYDGYACVEVEDRAFESSVEKKLDSLYLSARYLDQFVI